MAFPKTHALIASPLNAVAQVAGLDDHVFDLMHSLLINA